MYQKFFVWSFDDGLEQDRRIVEILRKYRIGATFHLNSGLFGDRTFEGRIGNLGMTEVPADRFDKSKKHLLPYVEHFRLEQDEAVGLYSGFEVASHTAHHVNLLRCDEEKRRKEIGDDIDALSALFRQQVVGFAFPYGVGAKQCRDVLQSCSVQYARTIGTAKDFSFPVDPLALPMTSWHVKKNALQTLQAFLNAKPEKDDLLFLMFAHGYEFDFGTKESNWQKLEQICRMVAGRNDVICCSVGDAFRMHKGEEPQFLCK